MKKISPDLEAMLETGRQHREEHTAASLPWACLCECCQRLRLFEAMSLIRSKASSASQRRGSAADYSQQSLRNWSGVHRRKAEQEGKAWTCRCRSCMFVREGRDTRGEKLEQFKGMMPGKGEA